MQRTVAVSAPGMNKTNVASAILETKTLQMAFRAQNRQERGFSLELY
jgi:hypothetical protein